MDASFRFCSGGKAHTRQTAHEQGPSACGGWETGAAGETVAVPKKGFSRVWTLERVRAEPAGLPAGWLRKRGGRGKSGQFSPRAKRPSCSGRVCQPLKDAREYAKRFFPASRRACQPFLKGKSPHKQHFSANQPKPGAPHSSAFAPPGQTASPPPPAAPLAPLGQGSVAPRAQFQPIIIPPPPPQAQDQRFHPPPPLRLQTSRRRQAPARGLAAVCALHRPTRNAKKHPCPLLVGHGCVASEPTALAAGTAGHWPPALPAFLTSLPLYKCRLPAIIMVETP